MDKVLLLSQLRLDEGLRLRPYLCPAGKLTIGYGRNLDDRGITLPEAEQMLLNDVNAVEKELCAVRVYTYLDPVRQAVLANMAFNMGMPALRGFKKMFECLELCDYEGAAAEMLHSKWAAQVGGRATRLAKLMKSGVA